ncbi:MAG: chromate transporter [Clostridia bacterium]|nr:chromate transporter [Clostridia bacterium]
MKNKLNLLWQLFFAFFKIGAFTFGGGYAMIPLIQREVVENKKWTTDDEILEMIAIAESTPGPIAINMATFIGTRTAGFIGAACATFGVVLPSFLIILPISYVLKEFQELQAVQFAFNGIRAGVLALLLKSLWTMYKKCPKGLVSYLLMGAAFLITAFLDVPVLVVLIGCALVGLITSYVTKRREQV